MRTHLALAVWPKTEGCDIALGVIENKLLELLEPPLNLKDVITPWTARIKMGRKVMADQARSRIPDA